MPVIYQGHCSSCDYESPTISDGHCGAVIAHDPSKISEYAVHPTDNRIVVLMHPLEQSIIEDHGYTYASATFQGRYLTIKDYFCKSCGHVYETRRLSSANLVFGCLPPLLVAIVVGATIGYIRSSFVDGFFAGMFATFVAWFVIDWLVGIGIRIRYADRNREFRIARVCPRCGSRRAATGGRLPCPQCKQNSMKVKAVGMS